MLIKIILKNFKCNLRNYILFFLGEILSVSMIFSVFAIREIIFSLAEYEMEVWYLKQYIKYAVIFFTVITCFFMAYSFRYYIGSRIKDYSLFKILGMRKRPFTIMLILEYGMGTILAFLVGIITGNIITYMMKSVIIRYYSEKIRKVTVSIEVYKNVGVICLATLILVMIIIGVIITDKDLSSLAKHEVKADWRPSKKMCRIFLTIGIICLFCSFFTIRKSYGSFNSEGMITLVMIIISIFFILVFGGILFLEWYKNQDKIYYRHLFSASSFSHKILRNTTMIFVLFSIQLFVLGYYVPRIAECVPITPGTTEYPYDFVWFSKEKDVSFAEKFAEQYKGKLISVPMVRISTQYGAEHVGISEKTYVKLKGKELSLKGKEIYMMLQGTTGMMQDIKNHKMTGAIIHIGKNTPETLSLVMTDENYDKVFSDDYYVKDITTENLYGNIHDGWREQVYVFSDEYFEQIYPAVQQAPEEHSVMNLLTIPEENRKEATKVLQSYVEQHGVEEYDPIAGVLKSMYSFDSVKEEKKAENILNIVINLFIVSFIFVGSVFFMAIRMFADIPELSLKYEFWCRMGMYQEERRKNIKRELAGNFKIATISSTVFAFLFLICYSTCNYQDIELRRAFMLLCLVMTIGFLLIQYLVNWSVMKILLKKICVVNDKNT